MYYRTTKVSTSDISLTYNNVPVTGTNKKENERMLSIYKKVLNVMKHRYPSDSHLRFQAFIKNKIHFYEENPSIAMIEILDLLYRYQGDEGDRRVFADIYEHYGNTQFLAMHLSQVELRHIKERYMAELIKIEEEEQDAVKKTTQES